MRSANPTPEKRTFGSGEFEQVSRDTNVATANVDTTEMGELRRVAETRSGTFPEASNLKLHVQPNPPQCSRDPAVRARRGPRAACR